MPHAGTQPVQPAAVVANSVKERQFISSENSNASINVIREIGYAVNMNKPILPLMLDDAPYAKASVSIS